MSDISHGDRVQAGLNVVLAMMLIGLVLLGGYVAVTVFMSDVVEYTVRIIKSLLLFGASATVLYVIAYIFGYIALDVSENISKWIDR